MALNWPLWWISLSDFHAQQKTQEWGDFFNPGDGNALDKSILMALGLKICLSCSDHYSIFFPVKQPCYKGTWNPFSQMPRVPLQRAFSHKQSYFLLHRDRQFPGKGVSRGKKAFCLVQSLRRKSLTEWCMSSCHILHSGVQVVTDFWTPLYVLGNVTEFLKGCCSLSRSILG